MPRLNKRTDGSGYYVTNAFARNGVIRHATYQPSDRAIEMLKERGIRSGDEFERELFFQLLEAQELTTGGTGPGEDADAGRNQWHLVEENPTQIPLDVTGELLNDDGTFISFGRFRMQYGGPNGYSDDALRSAHHSLNQRYQTELPRRLRELLTSHRPSSIKTEATKIVVELTPY